MTPEELLQPRVIVIAPIPLVDAEVGNIIPVNEEGYVEIITYWDRSFFINPYEFPHIFRRLEWWEKRSVDDLKYVKYAKVNNRRYGRPENCIIKIRVVDVEYGVCIEDVNEGYIFDLPDLTPATESEYNEFINSEK